MHGSRSLEWGVRKADNAIHQINHYPAYQVESQDLSSGYM